MKLWRKILLSLLCFIFGALLCFIVALCYFWNNTIRVTPKIIKQVRVLANYWVGIDFSLDSFYIMPSKRTISIDNLKLSIYDNSKNSNTKVLDEDKLNNPHFFGADKLIFNIASNSDILELFHSKVVIDKAEIKNIYYDMTASMPDSKNTRIEIPWIPIKKIIAKGFSLKTANNTINIVDFNANFNRDNNKGHLETSFTYSPFNTVASLTSDFLLDNGEANIKIYLNQRMMKKY